MNAINVWCTQFHADLTLSFLNPIRKQQQHAEACLGDNYDYHSIGQHEHKHQQ